MPSSTPYFSMAASVSPPPASENADDLAMACAMALVPSPNWSNSNTPTGPFQTMVPAVCRTFARCSAVSGPMSRIISSGRTSWMLRTSACAVAANSLATTTSVGNGISAPRAFACSRSLRAMSCISASCSDLPTLTPVAARKVFAMPPPTMSLSTLPSSDSSTVSLVETLLPATMATIGRAGLASARSRASSSPTSNGPAHATLANLPTPCVEASARCAVPNASMTKTSHSDAICLARSSLSFFSPLLKRTFSSSTAVPGSVSTPVSQSFLRGTFFPSSSESRVATGASENSSAYTPSSGRPRCEVRNTFAPFSIASLMVGSDARMRASLVTLPSSTGTFRSSRIRTRLPRRSWSAMRNTFMSRLRTLWTRRSWCRACGWRSPTRCRTTSRP